MSNTKTPMRTVLLLLFCLVVFVSTGCDMIYGAFSNGGNKGRAKLKNTKVKYKSEIIEKDLFGKDTVRKVDKTSTDSVTVIFDKLFTNYEIVNFGQEFNSRAKKLGRGQLPDNTLGMNNIFKIQIPIDFSKYPNSTDVKKLYQACNVTYFLNYNGEQNIVTFENSGNATLDCTEVKSTMSDFTKVGHGINGNSVNFHPYLQFPNIESHLNGKGSSIPSFIIAIEDTNIDIDKSLNETTENINAAAEKMKAAFPQTELKIGFSDFEKYMPYAEWRKSLNK